MIAKCTAIVIKNKDFYSSNNSQYALVAYLLQLYLSVSIKAMYSYRNGFNKLEAYTVCIKNSLMFNC